MFTELVQDIVLENLTLNTLTLIYKFCILFTIHFLSYSHGEFVEQPRVLNFTSISFMLMTLILDPGVILFGGIRYLSL